MITSSTILITARLFEASTTALNWASFFENACLEACFAPFDNAMRASLGMPEGESQSAAVKVWDLFILHKGVEEEEFASALKAYIDLTKGEGDVVLPFERSYTDPGGSHWDVEATGKIRIFVPGMKISVEEGKWEVQKLSGGSGLSERIPEAVALYQNRILKVWLTALSCPPETRREIFGISRG